MTKKLKKLPKGGTTEDKETIVTNTVANQLGALSNAPQVQTPAFYAKHNWKMSRDPRYQVDPQGVKVTPDMLKNDPVLGGLKVKPTWAMKYTDTKTGTSHYSPSYTSKEIEPYGWDSIHENKQLAEMSLGGILAEAGAGAGTGALGASVGGPIGAGLGAIIGGGVGLIKGLASHFGEKKAEKAQAEAAKKQDLLSAQARAGGMQNYQMMSNPFASTFPMGGEIPGGQPNVELEKEEVFQTPDGQVDQVDAPTHAQGGIKMNLPGGTRVWSDQLKSVSGKTFAEEAGKLEKQIEKYKKILS